MIATVAGVASHLGFFKKFDLDKYAFEIPTGGSGEHSSSCCISTESPGQAVHGWSLPVQHVSERRIHTWSMLITIKLKCC